MAGVPGFEPGLPDPKSGDLPLVDTPAGVRLVLRSWDVRLLLLIGVRGLFIGAGLILLNILLSTLLSTLLSSRL